MGPYGHCKARLLGTLSMQHLRSRRSKSCFGEEGRDPSCPQMDGINRWPINQSQGLLENTKGLNKRGYNNRIMWNILEEI